MKMIWKVARMDSGAIYEKVGSSVKIMFYKKGWFRGKEDKYVVSRLALGTRKNKSFKTERDAKKYITSLMH